MRADQRLDALDEVAARGQAVPPLVARTTWSPPAAERGADQRLAFALRVHVGGVVEGDAGIQRAAQHVQGFLAAAALAGEHAADPRSAETDFGDLAGRCAPNAWASCVRSCRRSLASRAAARAAMAMTVSVGFFSAGRGEAGGIAHQHAGRVIYAVPGIHDAMPADPRACARTRRSARWCRDTAWARLSPMVERWPACFQQVHQVLARSAPRCPPRHRCSGCRLPAPDSRTRPSASADGFAWQPSDGIIVPITCTPTSVPCRPKRLRMRSRSVGQRPASRTWPAAAERSRRAGASGRRAAPAGCSGRSSWNDHHSRGWSCRKCPSTPSALPRPCGKALENGVVQQLGSAERAAGQHDGAGLGCRSVAPVRRLKYRPPHPPCLWPATTPDAGHARRSAAGNPVRRSSGPHRRRIAVERGAAPHQHVGRTIRQRVGGEALAEVPAPRAPHHPSRPAAGS